MARDSKGRFVGAEQPNTEAANDRPSWVDDPWADEIRPKAIPSSWLLIPAALFVLGLVLYAVTHG